MKYIVDLVGRQHLGPCDVEPHPILPGLLQVTRHGETVVYGPCAIYSLTIAGAPEVEADSHSHAEAIADLRDAIGHGSQEPVELLREAAYQVRAQADLIAYLQRGHVLLAEAHDVLLGGDVPHDLVKRVANHLLEEVPF